MFFLQEGILSAQEENIPFVQEKAPFLYKITFFDSAAPCAEEYEEQSPAKNRENVRYVFIRCPSSVCCSSLSLFVLRTILSALSHLRYI